MYGFAFSRWHGSVYSNIGYALICVNMIALIAFIFVSIASRQVRDMTCCMHIHIALLEVNVA